MAIRIADRKRITSDDNEVYVFLGFGRYAISGTCEPQIVNGLMVHVRREENFKAGHLLKAYPIEKRNTK
jgi:hypothetical protein